MEATNQPVGPLAPSHTNAVASALSRAFFTDPMFTYILPDEGQRSAKLVRFFRSGARYGHRYGTVDAATRLNGGAIWLRPGATTVTVPRMLLTGMLSLPFVFGFASFRRFLTVASATEAAHKAVMPASHWYLLALGVEPAAQGAGLGGALLRPGLARADAAGQPCYLETMNERNLPFYERHGFTVQVAGVIPRGGPRFWAMTRAPRA